MTGNSYSNKSKLEIKLNVMFLTPNITRKYSESIVESMALWRAVADRRVIPPSILPFMNCRQFSRWVERNNNNLNGLISL